MKKLLFGTLVVGLFSSCSVHEEVKSDTHSFEVMHCSDPTVHGDLSKDEIDLVYQINTNYISARSFMDLLTSQSDYAEKYSSYLDLTSDFFQFFFKAGKATKEFYKDKSLEFDFISEKLWFFGGISISLEEEKKIKDKGVFKRWSVKYDEMFLNLVYKLSGLNDSLKPSAIADWITGYSQLVAESKVNVASSYAEINEILLDRLNRIRGVCKARNAVYGEKKLEIFSATYGGNCGVKIANQTENLRNACINQNNCRYKIDYQLIGDPVYGCAKDYEVVYGCAGVKRTLTLPAEASGKEIEFGCADMGIEPPIGSSSSSSSSSDGMVPTGTPGPENVVVNILGQWNASASCVINIYKDDGKYVEGECVDMTASHILIGNYTSSKMIVGSVMRKTVGCELTTPMSIEILSPNQVSYSQGGWNGCGIQADGLINLPWFRM